MKTVATTIFLALTILCEFAVAETPLSVFGRYSHQPMYDELLKPLAEELEVDVVFKPIRPPFAINIERELLYNPGVDALNLHEPLLTRMDEANWLQDLSDFPEIRAAAEQHYEYIKPSLYRKGRLLGIGQSVKMFSLPVVQLEAYAELGLSREDFPADWSSLHRQVIEKAQQGYRDFFYPAWYDSPPGLPLSFFAEVWNRGGQLPRPESGPPSMPENEGPAFETLRDWRRVWASGAVPKALLDQKRPDFQKSYLNGDFAISILSSDALLNSNEHFQQKNLTVTLVPRVEQPWGTPIVFLFCLAKTAGADLQHLSKQRALLKSISHGTGSQEFTFAEQNLVQHGLLSPYKIYMDSDAARQILRSNLTVPADEEVLMDLYESATVPKKFWDMAWHNELVDIIQLELRSFLQNLEITPQMTLSKMNHAIRALRSRHGY